MQGGSVKRESAASGHHRTTRQRIPASPIVVDDSDDDGAVVVLGPMPRHGGAPASTIEPPSPSKGAQLVTQRTQEQFGHTATDKSAALRNAHTAGDVTSEGSHDHAIVATSDPYMLGADAPLAQPSLSTSGVVVSDHPTHVGHVGDRDAMTTPMQTCLKAEPERAPTDDCVSGHTSADLGPPPDPHHLPSSSVAGHPTVLAPPPCSSDVPLSFPFYLRSTGAPSAVAPPVVAPPVVAPPVLPVVPDAPVAPQVGAPPWPIDYYWVANRTAGRNELLNSLGARSGQDRTDVREFLNLYHEAILDVLRRNGAVHLHDIGTLTVTEARPPQPAGTHIASAYGGIQRTLRRDRPGWATVTFHPWPRILSNMSHEVRSEGCRLITDSWPY